MQRIIRLVGSVKRIKDFLVKFIEFNDILEELCLMKQFNTILFEWTIAYCRFKTVTTVVC